MAARSPYDGSMYRLTNTMNSGVTRSMVEKYWAPTNDSMVSGHLRIGYEYFFMRAFRHLKSMQNLRVSSFFLTSTMALHHSNWDGCMAPLSSISWMCWCTSSTSCGTILLNLSLNGSSCFGTSSMMCSIASMQPILFFSKQKMW